MYELIKSKIFRPRQPWEKNLLVLWFGTFMAGVGCFFVGPAPIHASLYQHIRYFYPPTIEFLERNHVLLHFFSHDHCFSLVGPFSRPKRTQVNVITCFIRDGYRH